MTSGGFGKFINKTVDQWVDQALAEGELDLNPSPRCRVCQDPVIMQLVNKMLARAFTIPDILDTLASHNLKLKRENKPPITRDSLYNHRANHFEIQSPAHAVYRRIQEEVARNYGVNLETATGTLLNAVSYHQTMMMKGYETLIDPKYKVRPEDGAKSADRLHEIMSKDADSYDRARMLADMGRIVEVMRTYVPEDKWPEIQAVLKGENPESEAIEVEEVQMVDISDEPDPEGY